MTVVKSDPANWSRLNQHIKLQLGLNGHFRFIKMLTWSSETFGKRLHSG